MRAHPLREMTAGVLDFAGDRKDLGEIAVEIAALSENSTKFCLDVARIAKKHGTRISFDLNHRATFWKGREEELSEAA